MSRVSGASGKSPKVQWSAVLVMADEATRPRLGRGLAALIGEFPDQKRGDAEVYGSRKVAVEFLRPNPRNPRRRFAEAELEELAASIRTRGVIQPIVARAVAGVPGTYEIVAGERRWRAAQSAGLTEVPVVVVDIDDRGSLEYAILENVQRTDLNGIEEAAGYERLMREFGYTQKELAEILGKSRSHLANTLRLLQLSPAIQERVARGDISAGHARALLSVPDPDDVARRIVSDGLSVRDVEAMAAEDTSAHKARSIRSRSKVERHPGLRVVEHALARAFGLGVVVKAKPSGEGEIRIRYANAAELESLCTKLNVVPDA